MKVFFDLGVATDSALASLMPYGDNRRVSELDANEREKLERQAAAKMRIPYARSPLEVSTDGTPTAQRLIQATDDHVEVGGDDRATRVYRFKDSALARVYADLNARSTTEDQRSINRAQERALERYFTAYSEGGLHGNMGSVDCDRAGASNPSGRDHAAKTDFQVDARADWHRANYTLSNNERIVVEVVVLKDGSLEEAGRALGKLSQRRAIQAGRDLLRKAGDALVELWR